MNIACGICRPTVPVGAVALLLLSVSTQLGARGATPDCPPGLQLPSQTEKSPATQQGDRKPTTEGNGGGRVGQASGFTVPFFAIKATTARPPNVCIIADRSGSMDYGRVMWDFKAQKEIRGGKSNMDVLQEQLITTLHKLDKDSKFSIIFYDDTIATLPGVNGWQSKKDVPKAIEWIKEMQPDGETKPIPAFEQAFKLNPLPDVIFFMTDGVIDGKAPGQTLAAIEKLNTKMVDATDAKGNKIVKDGKTVHWRAVIIHTVQMQVPEFDIASLILSRSPKGVKSLQIIEYLNRIKKIPPYSDPTAKKALKAQFDQMAEIAERNGGQFVYIPYGRPGVIIDVKKGKQYGER